MLLGIVILLYIPYFPFNTLLPDDSVQLEEKHCLTNCINKKIVVLAWKLLSMFITEKVIKSIR